MTSTLIPKDPPRGDQESRKPEPETYPKKILSEVLYPAPEVSGSDDGCDIEEDEVG
jgi:hypothetical protein